MPTTAVGKIFKPALTLLQMEDVVRSEAARLGSTLTFCKAGQDPKRGVVARWRADADAIALRNSLSAYTFPNEEVTLD